jgi:2-dehydro-3-deoxygluconokinase
MPLLTLRPESECSYDALALGEVMLRLDPGEGRIKTARSFQVWEGGGEYNVVRGLRRCFGLRTGLVSAFADNEVGRLLEDLVLQGGVDTSLLRWIPSDGIGRTVRNGINFTERGFGVRGAVGVSDRSNTAASQIQPGDFDWETIFGKLGVRWFHTGGIFAALSESTAETTLEAITSARRHGVVVSYDLNYRPSLWKDRGGKAAADKLNRCIAGSVDVLIGVEVENLGRSSEVSTAIPGLDDFKRAIEATVEAHPNLKVVATTLRSVKSAFFNDWAGLCWGGGDFYQSPHYPNLEILDRIGGGDSFASGLIYGLLASGDLQDAVNLGVAHGALAMTTPGDTSMASLAEVRKLAKGSDASVER